MDEAALRQRALELGTQLVDIYVAGAVAASQGPAPCLPVELLAGDDPAGVARKRDEQVELAHREHQRATGGEHEPLLRPDLEIADPDKLPITRLHRSGRLRGVAQEGVIQS
jgi:hypothetical protein